MWRDVGGFVLGGREAPFQPLWQIIPPVLRKSCDVGVMGLVGVGLLFFFASSLTLLLAITVALLGRRPRWRGWLGLFPPLAPLTIYWALKERMYMRCALWGVSCGAYILLLILALGY
jgi:hypothetical protein